MELDPSQFLAPGSSEDESDDEDSRIEGLPNGNGPTILTSLGLTHINSVTSAFSSFMVRHLLLTTSRTFHLWLCFLEFR